jgi:predicted esterase
LARQLRELGMPVTSKEYQMPHAVIPEEIADIAAWLAARLG